jgi:hypothetical protein
MSSVEVEIYVSKFKKFFEQNPDQLTLLIGSIDPNIFYDGIKVIATENYNSERPVEPTRKQILDLLVEINTDKTKSEIKNIVKPFMEHHMGGICLN